MSRNKRDSLTDLKTVITGRKETQLLRRLATLTKDLNSDPSTHVGWLTSTRNSGSSRSDALFWPLQTPSHKQHVRTHMHTDNKIDLKEYI